MESIFLSLKNVLKSEFMTDKAVILNCPTADYYPNILVKLIN